MITALLRKEPDERPSAAETERMLLDAMEGREPVAAQAFVPTQSVPDEVLRSLGTDGPPGPSAPGTTQLPYPTAPAPAPTTRRGRGRWRTVVLVIAAAALVGGGAGLAAMKYSNRTDDTTGRDGTRTHAPVDPGKPDAETPPSAKPDTPVSDVPKGWKRVEDPEGFSLTVPEGWERRADGNQIDYTPDNGVHYIRISIDPAPDFENPYMHMVTSLEPQLAKRLPGYERKTLHSNTYRDRPGSLWEFTWTETKDHPGPRHAIDQMYFGEEGGPEYALYMTGPAEDWDTTRAQFDTMLRGWRPPGSSG